MLNDADCGFCMRTGRLVPRLGVDVDHGGRRRGEAAGPGAVAVGPDEGALAGEVDRRRRHGGHPIARRTYAWVAANRHRLPGGTAACELQR